MRESYSLLLLKPAAEHHLHTQVLYNRETLTFTLRYCTTEGHSHSHSGIVQQRDTHIHTQVLYNRETLTFTLRYCTTERHSHPHSGIVQQRVLRTHVSFGNCIPCQSCSQLTQIRKNENEHRASGQGCARRSYIEIKYTGKK